MAAKKKKNHHRQDHSPGPVSPQDIPVTGTNLYDISFEELSAYFEREGHPAYRATQVFEWVYRKNVSDYDAMSNLSKPLRAQLSEMYPVFLPPVTQILEDPADGTHKLLVELKDKSTIESVIIYEPDKTTLCISTQVGCPLGCSFCHTGLHGYIRNLSQAEIIAQYLLAVRSIPEKKITNLVFMGMGEPFLNYRHTARVLNILTSDYGTGISPRRITVSTSGILSGIKRFGKEFPKINLAISLNATTNEQRQQIMPVARKYGLTDLLQACRDYPLPRRKRITFEYVLIGNLNDTQQDAHRLVKLLRGIRCKINLIPVNDAGLSDWTSPSPGSVEIFQKILQDAGYTVMIRKSKGSSIGAACGQLWSSGNRVKEDIQ